VKLSSVIVRALTAFVATSALQLVAGMIAALLIPTKTTFDPKIAQHILYWMVLTNGVTVLALIPVAVRSEWRGWRLGAAVAAIPAAILFISGIEGAVFLKNAHIEWNRIFLSAAIAAMLNVPVWMLLFGKRQGGAEHFHPIASKSLGQRAWRLIACDVSYLVLYFICGTIIFPYVKDFYATQTLPAPGTIVALQLLLRGPVFLLLCLLMLRMLGMPRWSGALALGAVFTLLSGVAPLLMPNPYFPDSVRLVHLMEVTTSNFAFGVIVGWLWGEPKAIQSPALAHAA
jgi:hypothetical protein